MNKFNLFSEIYGCYFSVVENIIEQAESGLSIEEIENLVQYHGFYDSAFYLMPKIISKDWGFLEEDEDKIFYTNPNLSKINRPLSNLEKSWLKSILLDKRMLLFLSKTEINDLYSLFSDVEPLFKSSDFHIFDAVTDGDPYTDEYYIKHFKTILKACETNQPLKIKYATDKGKNFDNIVVPHKIIYSSRDDKFRVVGATAKSEKRYIAVTLNLSHMESVEVIEHSLPDDFDINSYVKPKVHPEPITISISTQRSALVRFMLQFASWENRQNMTKKTIVFTVNFTTVRMKKRSCLFVF